MISYRERFFAYNGLGPFKCYGCGKRVRLDDLYVHHKNHKPNDNRKENLVPMHHPCHTSQHSRGRRFSPEVIEKLRERSRLHPRVWTEAQKASVSRAKTEWWVQWRKRNRKAS